MQASEFPSALQELILYYFTLIIHDYDKDLYLV